MQNCWPERLLRPLPGCHSASQISIHQSRSRNTPFNDRCAPNFETVAPGRKAWSLSFELNQLRMTDGEVIVFEAAVDDREMFGFMALTSDPADTKTFGFVGNVVIIQSDENQPDAGPNVESYTMRPTVRRPAMLPRRIYGSGIPAATP